MELREACKPFEALTPHELYDILRLRSEVFVVEQNCVFQDMDSKDEHCYHVMVYADHTLVAYARLVPAGVSYTEMSIGRVVTSASVRSTGAGKRLMEKAIALCYEYFGVAPIRIGAQVYAEKFYERLGFKRDGAVYLEDGIEHIEMIKA